MVAIGGTESKRRYRAILDGTWSVQYRASMPLYIENTAKIANAVQVTL